MEKQDVVVQIEDRQTSPTLTSSCNEVLHRLGAEIENASSKQYNDDGEITKIQKVPRVMFRQRKFEDDYFIPREMSIGPIYAKGENPELKLKLAAQFIRTSGKTYTALLASIQKEIETLGTCFDIELLKDWSDEELAVMLLLDGCSVLQFIYSRVMDELKYLQINNCQAYIIEQDLFLMENQIPFRVLEILMDSLSLYDGAFNKNVYQGSIDSFVRMNLMTPAKVLPRSYWSFYEAKNTQPLHLLDILQSGLLYGFDYNSQNKSRYPRSNDKFREYFCHIKELEAFGIRLKSNSGSTCLRNVTFTTIGCCRGLLKLPALIVDDSTGRKLWNLIAYEMCPDNCNSEFGVTSYLSFLDSLVDSEEDIQQLRSAGVLRNRLSSDAKILQLFDEMSCNFVSDHVYHNVEDAIENHFNKIKVDLKKRVALYVVRKLTFSRIFGSLIAFCSFFLLTGHINVSVRF